MLTYAPGSRVVIRDEEWLGWVEDTMNTEPDPFLQVVAAVQHRA